MSTRFCEWAMSPGALEEHLDVPTCAAAPADVFPRFALIALIALVALAASHLAHHVSKGLEWGALGWWQLQLE